MNRHLTPAEIADGIPSLRPSNRRKEFRGTISHFRYPDVLDRRIADVFHEWLVPTDDYVRARQIAAEAKAELLAAGGDPLKDDALVALRAACTAYWLNYIRERKTARQDNARPVLVDDWFERDEHLRKGRIAADIYHGGERP